MKTRLLLILFAFFSFNCDAGIDPTRTAFNTVFSGRVFLISIGVDHYSKGKLNNIQYGQSDAQNFESFIKKDPNIKELKAFKMLDNSRKDQFIEHLNEIATEAKSADLFILYYVKLLSLIKIIYKI